MAFIRSKIKNGKPCYYIVESYRDGKAVRQRIIEYLGSAEKILPLALKGWQSTQKAKESESGIDFSKVTFKSYVHGSVMGLLYMAQYIGIEEILDEILPKKNIKGMTRGRVLLLAMIHRAVDPGSKRNFSNWVEQTSLPYHLKFEASALGSAEFWEAMDGISEDELKTAQRTIVKRISDITNIDLNRFHLDYTNYFTFINSKNGNCLICKRGHNKQKRDDLRQFSLAVLTAYSLQIPIIWDLYAGNKNDKSEFAEFSDKIKKELQKMSIIPEDVKITFDGGSNSEENFKNIGFHFICSHSLKGLPALYDIDISEYENVELSSGKTKLAYRIDNLTFSGVTGTGILTFSQDLLDGQLAELEKEITKIKNNVDDLNNKLKNPKSHIFSELNNRKKFIEAEIVQVKKYNDALKEELSQPKKGRRKKEKDEPIWDMEKELLQILAKKVYSGNQFASEFSSISIELQEHNELKSYQIKLTIDNELKESYCNKYYGKKLTCTDYTSWSTSDILSEYANQECIENNIFKVSKDTRHFSVRPQYHWTDDKIRCHVFICLSAMIIAEMLRMRMEKAGLKLTKSAMLNKLSLINDGWIYNEGKKVVRAMGELDSNQKRMWNVIEDIKQSLSTN